jgi:hypothetical protein
MIIPPTDVAVAVFVVVALSVVLLMVGRFVAARKRAIGYIVASLAGLVLLLHALWLNDNLLLTRVIPTANVMVLGNLALPAAALLAGTAWSLLKAPRWQKITCAAAILGLGLWRLVGPLYGRVPSIGPDRWTTGVCRQSSTSSCSAAAAATLLAAHQIPATEREMIALCFTHVDGTSMLGLYRGLYIKSAGAALVPVAGHPSVDELRAWPLPAIVTIGLRGNGGWLPIGNRHSILVLSIDDVHAEIADPFSGKQTWTTKQFTDAYARDALALKRVQ